MLHLSATAQRRAIWSTWLYPSLAAIAPSNGVLRRLRTCGRSVAVPGVYVRATRLPSRVPLRSRTCVHASSHWNGGSDMQPCGLQLHAAQHRGVNHTRSLDNSARRCGQRSGLRSVPLRPETRSSRARRPSRPSGRTSARETRPASRELISEGQRSRYSFCAS